MLRAYVLCTDYMSRLLAAETKRRAARVFDETGVAKPTNNLEAPGTGAGARAHGALTEPGPAGGAEAPPMTKADG